MDGEWGVCCALCREAARELEERLNSLPLCLPGCPPEAVVKPEATMYDVAWSGGRGGSV